MRALPRRYTNAATRPRLVLVEGLPGSGKSTTAKTLVARLRQKQLAAVLYPEVDADHPLNVGGALHPAGATTGEELFRRYTVEAYIARAWTAGARSSTALSLLTGSAYWTATRTRMPPLCCSRWTALSR
jgi:hypothetical protein